MSGELCEAWWGSHTCDLEPKHDGPHRCCAWGELCSEYDEGRAAARYWLEDDRRWSEWAEQGA